MSQSFVGLAGAGRWGRNLARNFYQLGALHTVCDANPNSLVECQQMYPGVSVTTDFDGLLRDPHIRAIALATPAISHYALASRALSAGKHVYVEKPLALDYSQGEALAQQANGTGLILMVGHLLQYHPAVTSLLLLVRSGQLGTIHYLYSHRMNLGAIRTDENALWSLAPHDISVLLAVVGAMPARVSAIGGKYLQPAIEDEAVVNLAFDGGVQGQVMVSWLHPVKVQRLVVVGSKKAAVFDDVATESKLVLYDKGVTYANGQFTTKHSEGEAVVISNAEPLNLECRHFLECIAEGQRPRTDAEEGLRVLQVLEASQRSLEAAGQWVALSAKTGRHD
ncbi:MAG: Gfo/Idh/MocA family oxidoreductase [Chloroflexi bacterium]|nr:Gfo/Idh/MocA family oxidoreductase [Chloroflexota bacterium]